MGFGKIIKMIDNLVVDLKAEYPYQEPMIGPDYQIGVPRSVSGSSKQRDDECIWSPRQAGKEAGVEQYLQRVRRPRPLVASPARPPPRLGAGA